MHIADSSLLYLHGRLDMLEPQICEKRGPKTYVEKIFECKTNMIPILMHQMRISTTKVSSVVLRPKKVGNPGKKICENCTRAPKKSYCASGERCSPWASCTRTTL
jgi:hypothetical protein